MVLFGIILVNLSCMVEVGRCSGLVLDKLDGYLDFGREVRVLFLWSFFFSKGGRFEIIVLWLILNDYCDKY